MEAPFCTVSLHPTRSHLDLEAIFVPGSNAIGVERNALLSPLRLACAQRDANHIGWVAQEG